MRYESSTNRRLHDPTRARELALEAVEAVHRAGLLQLRLQDGVPSPPEAASAPPETAYRAVLGLGPGRSGTRSLAELLSVQPSCVHAEHEMVVRRRFRRDASGRIDPGAVVPEQASVGGSSGSSAQKETTTKKKKGSWGSDRRLEWDVPRLVRGAAPFTEAEEASWRVMRLLEQRHMFDEWVLAPAQDDTGGTDDSYVSENKGSKPRRLGARGWRRHNSSSGGEHDPPVAATAIDEQDVAPVVAAVSSVGLSYVHEYVALDPNVKIVVLMRPREEVVTSFLEKSRNRNHWQRHEGRGRQSHDEQSAKVDLVQPDKTWDNAFPNMSADECRPFASAGEDEGNGNGSAAAVEDDPAWRPDKTCAIRAYWELYHDIALALCQQYPRNVRVFDMGPALNDAAVQRDLLRFCGFDEAVLDTSSEVHLNKKK